MQDEYNANPKPHKIFGLVAPGNYNIRKMRWCLGAMRMYYGCVFYEKWHFVMGIKVYII